VVVLSMGIGRQCMPGEIAVHREQSSTTHPLLLRSQLSRAYGVHCSEPSFPLLRAPRLCCARAPIKRSRAQAHVCRKSHKIGHAMPRANRRSIAASMSSESCLLSSPTNDWRSSSRDAYALPNPATVSRDSRARFHIHFLAGDANADIDGWRYLTETW
jgi:hypothetical protein